jgi:hypothetical protein
MTRGRQANTAHVVTGQTAPPGHPPCQQATAEAVLASVLQREADDLSATEQIRQAQEWAGGTGHLLTLWSAATRPAQYPDIDRRITATLTESQAWRYQREPSRAVLQRKLRQYQLAGHDISQLIDQITAAPMDGVRSISSVLHGRLQHVPLPDPGHAVTWAQRTPDDAPQIAHELAASLDERRRELGERLAATPEPWLTRHLGVLPGDVSPALREDYVQRAGTAAAYREACGITDPQQAVSFGPHPGPELAAMQLDTLQALEIADEQAEIRAVSRGALEARVLEGERAETTAPLDVSGRLRLTAHAEADAWQQSAAAETENDLVQVYNARALANHMAAEKFRLEAASTRYEEWSAKTASTRETAGKARAELQRRGHQPALAETPERQSALEWWREFEADVEAADRALARQEQAAIDVCQPWPPVRYPAAQSEAERAPRPGYSMPERPEILGPGANHEGERAARLDDLQARAGDAAAWVQAQRTELNASSEYTARIEREAHAEPEAGWQAEARDEIEMEL